MGKHDLSYRSFFVHRRMIQDLLREIVGEGWVERIDFESGERVDTSFVSPRHENRESDDWREVRSGVHQLRQSVPSDETRNHVG